MVLSILISRDRKNKYFYVISGNNGLKWSVVAVWDLSI